MAWDRLMASRGIALPVSACAGTGESRNTSSVPIALQSIVFFMIFLQSVASSVPLFHDDNTLGIKELPPFCQAWSNSLGLASARQLHRIERDVTVLVAGHPP